jgi:hypothetical protein
MSQTRKVIGIVVGVLLVLSAGAHSFLGGAAIRSELLAANVPADLLRGATIGWQFGGVAMLAFGGIVLHTFVRRREAAPVSLVPARIVAATYLLFGAGALVLTGFDPFFLVFVVPGLLLALASYGAGTGTAG